MRGLVIAQHINKQGRHDATGAFIPGAKQFAKKYKLGEPLWLNDSNDRRKMLDAIARCRDLDVIAYFGHGQRNGLPSADITSRHLTDLAAAIRTAAAPGCQVVLYACSAGAENCFAQKLSELLSGKSFRIWGHTCPGHSYTNPFVTRYPYRPEDAQPFLIVPDSPLWDAWYALIKSKSDIWMRYPFMAKRAVEAEIEQSGLVRSGSDRVSMTIMQPFNR